MLVIKKEDFVKEFIANFVPNEPIKKLKKLGAYPPDGYLWKICDYGLVSCYIGTEAMSAYNKADKTDAVEIQYDNGFIGGDVTCPLSEEYNAAEKIRENCLPEFYVIGKDFSWCYIQTHEMEMCGPYFIWRDIEK